MPHLDPVASRTDRVSLRRWHVALGVLLALPGAALAQAPDTPQTHSVRPGDTLWSLAQSYLGDPLLWPEIYRLNTDVVEDPHWIYPGEVLRLASSDAVTAVPTTDTPPVAPDTSLVAVRQPEQPAAAPADTDATDMSALFSQGRRNQMMQETLRAYSEQPYHPLRRSEYFSSGFLTEGHDLPFGRLDGRVTPPQIAVLSNQTSGLLYSEMTVTPPDGATTKAS